MKHGRKTNWVIYIDLQYVFLQTALNVYTINGYIHVAQGRLTAIFHTEIKQTAVKLGTCVLKKL